MQTVTQRTGAATLSDKTFREENFTGEKEEHDNDKAVNSSGR